MVRKVRMATSSNIFPDFWVLLEFELKLSAKIKMLLSSDQVYVSKN